MLRTSLSLLVIAVVALATLLATPALACSRLAFSNANGLTTLPLEGQGAPRSARVWHVLPAGTTASLELRDGAGALIPSTATRVSLGGEAGEELAILTPVSLFAPGTVDFLVGGERVVRFTVVDEVDTTAPPALSPVLGEVAGEYFGAYSCGNPASVAITVGKDTELVLALREGEAWPGVTALGVGTGSVLQLSMLDEGPQRLSLVHVDLSGNASAPASVELTVPAKQSGCSAAGGWALVAPALALLGRRRRRASQ